MIETHPTIKKLQFKDHGQVVLILDSPIEYEEVIKSFKGEVHQEPKNNRYDFIQVFGTTNDELKTAAKAAESYVEDDGLFWLCYPKKSSKNYKGSDCSRETVTTMLAEEGYEPVRQIAINEDWSALRFRKVEKIKKMNRKFAVTELGKQRTE